MRNETKVILNDNGFIRKMRFGKVVGLFAQINNHYQDGCSNKKKEECEEKFAKYIPV